MMYWVPLFKKSVKNNAALIMCTFLGARVGIYDPEYEFPDP